MKVHRLSIFRFAEGNFLHYNMYQKSIQEKLDRANYDFLQQYNELFEKDYWDWKGDNKQIDDVLLIGIEF